MSVDASLTRHGGLSYLEIPALDAAKSATFYAHVLGWRVEDRGRGAFAFTDEGGHLIGRWTTAGPAEKDAGWRPNFYVVGLDAAVARVRERGGEIVEPPRSEGDLRVARVRDPAGNVLGLWEAMSDGQ
ncbi:MAG: VOC family protein [Thermoplasmatota archaeon]